MKKFNYLTVGVLAFVCIIPVQFTLAETDIPRGPMMGSSTPQDRLEQMKSKTDKWSVEIGKNKEQKIVRIEDRLASSTNRVNKLEDRLASSTNRVKRLEEAKARLASTTAARLERQNKQAKEMFTKQSDKIVANYRKAINQLTDIADRIQSRIDKLVIQGIDISATTTDLTNAKSKIAIAQTALADLQSYIDSQTITAQNRQQILATIKSKGEAVKTAVKDAHNSLIKVLAALKNEALKNIDTTATTTATTTASTTNQ